MDENYLDDLLKQVSSDNEEQSNSLDQLSDADIDIDMSDLGDISLDELDGLDNIDLSGLELDDIDFDDVDVMSLDTDRVKEAAKATKSEKEEDFSLDGILEEIPSPDTDESPKGFEEPKQQDVFAEADKQIAEDLDYPETMDESTDDNVEDSIGSASDSVGTDSDEDNLSSDSVDSMDLDDLFSALGIDSDDGKDEGSAYTAGQDELDNLLQASMAESMESGEFDDIEDISDVKGTGKSRRKKKASRKKNGEPKEKRSISEIIFGVPDEDDLEEERLLEEKRVLKNIKKEKKKAESEEKKAAKSAQKKDALELKKHDSQRKAGEKAEKKKAKQAKLQAEYEAELAEEGGKRVSTPVVIVVFAIFAVLAGTVIIGTNSFNYSQVIKKAADYFERQRYRLAYDEVSGVDVKKKDEDLKDRIYTVMYVERLYESYENNLELGRPDKALDALLRGLEKYDQHYQEAVELDIVEDILDCRTEILFALSDTYGLTEEQAYDIIELEGHEYTQALIEYSEGVQTGE